MTISPAVIDALIAAGATAEIIAAAVKADAAGEEARLAHKRSVNAERQRRFRASRMSRDVTVTERDRNAMSPLVTVSHGDSLPPKKDIKPPSSSSLRSDDRPVPKTTPRLELQAILDDEHVAAVIDHRQRLGSPLTAHAAKLLAAEFAKCGNPNAAADTMLSRGWRGFKPKWLEERHNGSTGPPPKRKTGSANLIDALNAFERRSHELDRDQEPADTAVRAIRNGSG